MRNNIEKTLCKLSSEKTIFGVFFLVYIVKFLLLFVIIPFIYKQYPEMYQIENFPDEYDDIAMNIVNGNGYRVYENTCKTMIREPGYVAILTIIFQFLGNSLLSIKIVNVVFSGCIAILVIKFSKSITSNYKIAYASGIIYLLHPAIILAESRGGIEIVFCLLCIIFVFVLHNLLLREQTVPYIIAGVILGFACLIKSTVILFPLFMYIFLSFSKRKKEVFLITKKIALLLVGMLVILMPWVVRNYCVSGRIVPTMTLSGSIAQEGLFASESAGSGLPYFRLGMEASESRAAIAKAEGFAFRKGWHLYFYSSQDEVDFDRLLLSRVYRKYIQKPHLFLRTVISNSWRFWFQGRTKEATLINVLCELPFLCICISGGFIAWKYKLRIEVVVLFIVYFYLVHLPLQGLARYHVPLIPFLALLGGIVFVLPVARVQRINVQGRCC